MVAPEKKTLLLVEDEAILALTEKKQLEKYGYAVRTVSSGEEAVEYVKEFPGIDLILMDINLGDGIDGTQGRKVRIEKRLQDFNLDARRLQPLGIIINELITNIMKYAFPDRENGCITVSATNEDRNVSISIQDDGIGMPESVSFDNSTGFGLQLVHALTLQLQGSIRIERGARTKVALDFDF